MPGTSAEYLRYATTLDLPADFPIGQRWLDGTEITAREGEDVFTLWIYRRQQLGREFIRHLRRSAQRKAMRLFLRYLSPDQTTNLRRKGEVIVTLPSGNAYRVDVRRGRTEQVTRHGRRYFVARRFCLHEQSLLVLQMPPADLALTHFLLLHADEQEFLALANATDVRDQLWNGAYLRRLREARRQKLNAERSVDCG